MDIPPINQFELPDTPIANDDLSRALEFTNNLTETKEISYVDEYFDDASFIEHGIGSERWPSSKAFLSEACTRFESEGKHGSALYLEMMYDSVLLETQLTQLKEGNLDVDTLNSRGIALVIDIERTTDEMLTNGEAVLTKDFMDSYISTINQLRAYIPGYVIRSINSSASAAAEILTGYKIPASPKDVIRIITGENSYEKLGVPLTQNEADYLEERLSGGYTSREELNDYAERLLTQMMKNRLGLAGLDGISYINTHQLPELAQILTVEENQPVNINGIERAMEIMRQRTVLDEIGMYPGYLPAIEDLVKLDLAN